MQCEDDTYLKLPEQSSRMTMVVVSQWDVFSDSFTFWNCFQNIFNMFEKPRFVPFADVVDLAKLIFQSNTIFHRVNQTYSDFWM